MEEQLTITCPHCGRIIADDPLIAAAVTGEGEASQAITCECGETISFWAVTAQLREQKKFGVRFEKWLRELFKGRG